jgi:hypothetical protein
MKHPRSLLLALALVTLGGCSTDDPSTPSRSEEQSGGSGGQAPGTGGKAAGGAGGKAAGGAGGKATGGAGDPGTGGSGDGGSGDGGSGDGGSGGKLPADAAAPADTSAPIDTAAPGSDATIPADGPAPFMECPKPSIDRIQQWNATSEGTTTPMNGTLLVKEGDHYVAKETWKGNEWHVLEILIANAYEAQADFSASKGFTLTYSATADMWMQLRPASKYSGGDKWVTKIPSTGGMIKQAFFDFMPASWTTVAELGKPSYTLAFALKEARGLLLVGKTPNVVVLTGLRIDGYTPMCR